jgi:hypothetical protein
VRTSLAAAGLALVVASTARAQSAQQTVTYEVQAVNQIAVSGNVSLTVSSATAGQAPSATSATSSYAITTNEDNKKITASLNTNMPSGLTLTVNLTAPSGGTSAGAVTLSTTAQDVVTGISKLNSAGLSISYQLTATSAAGVVAQASKTVTLTIVTGP